MTRAEYLAELDSHLITLPKEERDMAVSFYEEYFEDAGPDQEQAVMEELGKPYHLARTIIGETSLYSKSEVYIKYKESKPMPQNSTGVFVSLQKPDAFAEQGAAEEDIMPERARNAQNTQNAQGMPASNGDGIKMYGANAENDTPKAEEKKDGVNTGNVNFDQYYTHAGEERSYTPPPPPQNESMSTGWVIFWILMLIFVIIPFIVPIILAMAAIALVSAACFIAALIALVTGIIDLATSIPAGLGLIFAALLCAGIGFLLLSPTILFFGKALPWTFRMIAGLFTKRRAA